MRLRSLALFGALLPAIVIPASAEARHVRHARHAKKAVHHVRRHRHKVVRAKIAAKTKKPAPVKTTTTTTTTTAPDSTTAVPTVPILQPVSPVAPADTTTLLTTTATPTTTDASAPTTTASATATATSSPEPATTTSAGTDTTTTTAPTATTPVAADTTPSAPRLFAADSFWNALLPNDAPLDAQSSTYVSQLQGMVTTSLPWINTSSYSEPVYTVGADQPGVKVTLDKPAPLDPTSQALADSWKSVPIPDNAVPAAGTDHNLVIYQPSTDSEWEFWSAVKQADGWHAKWGGTMHNVSTNPGYYTDYSRFGASGAGLPVLGGLMRIDEVTAGHIDHALAISLPQTRADVYSWPAQRTDGNVNSTTAIPEGTRFRLPASLDLSKIAMSGLVRQMAVAAQKYGIVVRDRSSSVAFYGEDPTPSGSNIWNIAYGRNYPSTLLAQFPWSKLQALKTQLAVDPY